MEDIVLTFFRFVGAFFRMLFQFFIMDIICFGVGWVVSKVFTLGRFPSFTPDEKERDRVSNIGAIILLLFLLAIGVFNSL
ncbi:conserved hypothetical protein [Vibrio chagasii]|uniref:hypothetical protein n=1 Tax=Vibrio TaxID=662 RepID=UPI000CF55770|nr:MULTISPECIES: hypothetical protein [Vibrio]MCG9562247.1 hypothetical protein [Vibrio chagasii]MCG9569390.1 hypothetical protein [Vibrio chagasii]NOI38932.1 hypothetical protein [Vibrio sp. 070316B]NOI84246.1 hypothetical protein [Vibrio sp. 99K-1]NOI96582.1 hypothetical protein [Vibrio sp. T3Y01]